MVAVHRGVYTPHLGLVSHPNYYLCRYSRYFCPSSSDLSQASYRGGASASHRAGVSSKDCTPVFCALILSPPKLRDVYLVARHTCSRRAPCCPVRGRSPYPLYWMKAHNVVLLVVHKLEASAPKERCDISFAVPFKLLSGLCILLYCSAQILHILALGILGILPILLYKY